jgi:hypothetical protein
VFTVAPGGDRAYYLCRLDQLLAGIALRVGQGHGDKRMAVGLGDADGTSEVVAALHLWDEGGYVVMLEIDRDHLYTDD